MKEDGFATFKEKGITVAGTHYPFRKVAKNGKRVEFHALAGGITIMSTKMTYAVAHTMVGLLMGDVNDAVEKTVKKLRDIEV